MRATIQCFAYKEPALGEVMDAVADQPVPDGWDVSYQAVVTPTGPGCGTAAMAEDHGTFEYVEAPKGKLNARNDAHEAAVESGTDVIVSWDGDAPPSSSDTLALILSPLEAQGVVATNSRTVHGMDPFSLATSAASAADRFFRRPIYGRLSAFTVEGWDHAGPFDTDVDQLDVRSIREEEEFDFRRRLAEVGEVVDTRATVQGTNRRVQCKVERAFGGVSRYPRSEWCERRGIDTFGLAEERARQREVREWRRRRP